jgi:hypothetical protein
MWSAQQLHAQRGGSATVLKRQQGLGTKPICTMIDPASISRFWAAKIDVAAAMSNQQLVLDDVTGTQRGLPGGKRAAVRT